MYVLINALHLLESRVSKVQSQGLLRTVFLKNVGSQTSAFQQ